MRSQNSQYLGGRDVDPVVDPEFRGQRLFGKLLEFGGQHFEGLDFFFNFANPVSIKGFERMGWRRVMRLADRVYQLGFRRLFSPEFLLWSLNRATRPAGQNTQTRELSAAELEDLLSADPSPSVGQRLGVLRSPDYLRWRFLQHPFHTYRYFWASGQNRSFSLAICRVDPENELLLVIDLVGFGREPHLGEWLHSWSGSFPYHRIVSWSSLPSHNHRGFFENPIGHKTGLPFLVRPGQSKSFPDGAWSPSNWQICRGDLEIL